MEDKTRRNQSVADCDNNHELNQASGSGVRHREIVARPTRSAQDSGEGNLDGSVSHNSSQIARSYSGVDDTSFLNPACSNLAARINNSDEDLGVNNDSDCWREQPIEIDPIEVNILPNFQFGLTGDHLNYLAKSDSSCFCPKNNPPLWTKSPTAGTNSVANSLEAACGTNNSACGTNNSAFGTNNSTFPTNSFACAANNSACETNNYACGTNDSACGSRDSACRTNNAAMLWKLRAFFSRKPSEVNMRIRNLSSSYQSVQNVVLQRRLSFDMQVDVENDASSVPKLRRCYSGPARQNGGLSTNVMPPLPNNQIEKSPRPQIAIGSLPKHSISLPGSPTNNSPINLLNNSPSNLRNNANSRNGSMTTFETTRMPSSNGISDHGSSSTSNGVHEILDTSNFNREIERLKTFEGWRVPFLSAAQMASAGFYFTKKDDIVKCAFCGVEVGSWVEGDNPMVDHQRWSPACRFLRKLPVGNVPITAADLSNIGLQSQSRTSSEGYDTCGSQATRQYGIVLRHSAPSGGVEGGCGSNGGLDNIRAIEKLGIQQMRPPAYPMFATNESRIASYTSWPISLKLKPNVLSEAGFFYTGKGDQTICYYCGGGLKDWEESDVPWEEHAKWFNRCNYVLSIKGKEFVDKVCNKKPEEDEKVRTEATESESVTESTEPRNESEPSTSSVSTSTVSEQSSSATTAVNGTVTASSSSSGTASTGIEAPATADSRLCKICYMEEMGILFLPCGHIVACPKCALLLTTCAVCRKPYSATVRAFLS